MAALQDDGASTQLTPEEQTATAVFAPVVPQEQPAGSKPRRAHAAANRVGWSKDEDEFILDRVHAQGMQWSVIASALPGRTDDAVRNRYLRLVKRAETGDVKAGAGDMWTNEEDIAILDGVAQHGFKWMQIALALPGRSANAVRNRYLRGNLAGTAPDDSTRTHANKRKRGGMVGHDSSAPVQATPVAVSDLPIAAAVPHQQPLAHASVAHSSLSVIVQAVEVDGAASATAQARALVTQAVPVQPIEQQLQTVEQQPLPFEQQPQPVEQQPQ